MLSDATMRLATLVLVGLAGSSALAAPPPRCVIDRTAPQVATPPATVPPCWNGTAALQNNVRLAAKQRYQPTRDKGRAEVAFHCDGLGARIREIVVENGSGHGGTLGLYRARRNAAGTYDVRGIAYANRAITAGAPPFKLVSGTVALPDLAYARTALAATVREVWPPPPPHTIGGIRGFNSSSDFHALVKLVDDDGRVVEKEFTGYHNSSDQDNYLLLELALGALDPITKLAPNASAPTAEDRALFDERFAASVPLFDAQFHWWVMERQVDLARFLGTPRTIPGLLTRLDITKTDRQFVDARAHAVEALATITGWNARNGGASIDEAATRYLAECK